MAGIFMKGELFSGPQRKPRDTLFNPHTRLGAFIWLKNV